MGLLEKCRVGNDRPELIRAASRRSRLTHRLELGDRNLVDRGERQLQEPLAERTEQPGSPVVRNR